MFNNDVTTGSSMFSGLGNCSIEKISTATTGCSVELTEDNLIKTTHIYLFYHKPVVTPHSQKGPVVGSNERTP